MRKEAHKELERIRNERLDKKLCKVKVNEIQMKGATKMGRSNGGLETRTIEYKRGVLLGTRGYEYKCSYIYPSWFHLNFILNFIF